MLSLLALFPSFLFHYIQWLLLLEVGQSASCVQRESCFLSLVRSCICLWQPKTSHFLLKIQKAGINRQKRKVPSYQAFLVEPLYPELISTSENTTS